jgi:hypothetical protein
MKEFKGNLDYSFSLSDDQREFLRETLFCRDITEINVDDNMLVVRFNDYNFLECSFIFLPNGYIKRRNKHINFKVEVDDVLIGSSF